MSSTKPYVVGVCGGSGSGKGYFVDTLLNKLGKDKAAFLSLDHYYVNIEQQHKDVNGIENFDLPAAIDSAKFANDLALLRKGQNIELKAYTFNNPDEKAKLFTIESRPIIIVEGIFIFHYKEVAKQLDLKLFVEAPDHLKIKRRILRDNLERGYDLADVLYRYEYHVSPAYDQFISPYKSEADMVINNNTSIDIAADVIGNHIKQYL